MDIVHPSCNFWNILLWKPKIVRAGCNATSRYGSHCATELAGCSVSHQICLTRHNIAIRPNRHAMQFAIRTQSCIKQPLISPLGLDLDFPLVPLEIQMWRLHGNPLHSKDPTFIRNTYWRQRRNPNLSFGYKTYLHSTHPGLWPNSKIILSVWFNP